MSRDRWLTFDRWPLAFRMAAVATAAAGGAFLGGRLRKPRNDAPLPAYVWSMYGKVPVIIGPPNLSYKGVPVYGLWFDETRQIVLRAGMHPNVARGVLKHEECHVALDDFGVELPEALEDRVCNAIEWHAMQRPPNERR